jgi:hypothetical protein
LYFADLVEARKHGLGHEVGCSQFLSEEFVRAKVESFGTGVVVVGEMGVGSDGSGLGSG